MMTDNSSYIWFQMHTHHGVYDAVLRADEERDQDRHKDLMKDKLTFTECAIALIIALTCVSLHAVFLGLCPDSPSTLDPLSDQFVQLCYFLKASNLRSSSLLKSKECLLTGLKIVEEIEYIVARGVSDSFMGLILVPLVEKVAEHLTAVDEAWDNQMNFALAHVLGATIQTALFNSSLTVLVGWGLGKQMDLNFEVFNIIVLILAIIVVGNFLRDQKSNYLEGSLCILTYIIIGKTPTYQSWPSS